MSQSDMRGPVDPRFEAFFNGEHDRLVASLALVVGDREAAAEAVAEAMARAWREVRKGHDLENLGGWIRVVALNFARRSFRRRAMERRLYERVAADAPVSAADAQIAPDLAEVLANLSEREREVAVLHWVLHIPVSEVARDLGIAPGTVENYLRRARNKLCGVLARPDATPVKR